MENGRRRYRFISSTCNFMLCRRERWRKRRARQSCRAHLMPSFLFGVLSSLRVRRVAHPRRTPNFESDRTSAEFSTAFNTADFSTMLGFAFRVLAIKPRASLISYLCPPRRTSALTFHYESSRAESSRTSTKMVRTIWEHSNQRMTAASPETDISFRHPF